MSVKSGSPPWELALLHEAGGCALVADASAPPAGLFSFGFTHLEGGSFAGAHRHYFNGHSLAMQSRQYGLLLALADIRSKFHNRI